MEVKNECVATLSNYEVYSLLNDIQRGINGQKKPNKYLTSLATICFSSVKYLEKTPCKEQSDEIVAKFIKSLEPFNLTKGEKLQLLNHRPTTAVEIQLIIEESEERLSEEQTEQILNIIAETLPDKKEGQTLPDKKAGQEMETS